ncbi:MAG: ATP-binding protein [Clostridiales bacterium]|nr:ATP-binding protein [Clostridiales bacterium]
MFIGRQQELEMLNDLYNSNRFEFLVLYGKRRVGKTTLLSEFSKDKNSVFYSAQEKNSALNIESFSKAVQVRYSSSYFGTFESWDSAFRYIGDNTGDERQVIIIDEFPFVAQDTPSIKSTLQHIIDHEWKQKKIFLILCGSSISFMENEVLGYKSPLYGRATATYELLPFDYYDSASFFPNYSINDKLIAYGILGGIPCYLENFSDKLTIAENLEKKVLKTGAFLKEEPQVLLRMELREPAVYNSIFEAISNGASRMNEIAGKIHEDSSKCSKYLDTLRTIKLIEKKYPAGEKETSRKTIYSIADPFFLFWFYFIFSNRSYYEIIGPQKAAKDIVDKNNLSDYMGTVFEKICTEYMKRKAREGKLPFYPNIIGKWWGNNPEKKQQDDVDILLIDKSGEAAIFCECKYRNELFGKSEFEDLVSSSNLFQKKHKYYYLFSKSGFTKWVQDKANKSDNIKLIKVNDLFDI